YCEEVGGFYWIFKMISDKNSQCQKKHLFCGFFLFIINPFIFHQNARRVFTARVRCRANDKSQVSLFLPPCEASKGGRKTSG
ncbi:TPA: hypothetical protein ACHS7C_005461, partial [Klebsiella variicola]